MEHLVIGAAQAAPIREYLRSWEQATGRQPPVSPWATLCSRPLSLPPLPVPAVLVRMTQPDTAERALLSQLGGAPSGMANVEGAPFGPLGLLRASAALEEELYRQGVTPIYATPPRAFGILLDRELRQRVLSEGEVPLPEMWTLPKVRPYEALRDRLRQVSGRRVIVRLRRSVGPTPAVLVWHGGRGLRAQANCCFTPMGAALSDVHPIEDEVELRPLLGRLFELGAVVHVEVPPAEIEGRPFHLWLMATGARVVMGRLVGAGVWPLRAEAPPVELPQLRRQISKDLYQRIERACVQIVLSQRAAALTFEVTLNRRFDDFRVLEIDPFVTVEEVRRDAIGWTPFDHLGRALRSLGEAHLQGTSPSTGA